MLRFSNKDQNQNPNHTQILRMIPKIEDYKITNGEKFKKGLPNQTAFIFEDPKDADEFYSYINVKFNRNYQDVEYYSAIEINDSTYYISFFETERSDKTINLIPIAADALIQSNNISNGDTFNSAYSCRSGQWYLIVTVNDEHLKDALSIGSVDRLDVIKFLREMKHEYLTTANYQEIYFKNPPMN